MVPVVGAVKTPRSIPLSQGLTVTKAIEAAGGFGDFANSHHVGLFRGREGRFYLVDVRGGTAKEAGC